MAPLDLRGVYFGGSRFHSNPGSLARISSRLYNFIVENQPQMAFGGIVLLFFTFFLLPANYQKRIKSISDIQMAYSRSNPYGNATQSRFLIWAAGYYIILDHPFGVGQGNVSEIFPKYKPPILLEDNVPHLHNNLLQICAQNGWIGLGAYLFWIFSYLITFFKFNRGKTDSTNLNWAFNSIFLAVFVWGFTEYTFSHQFMNIQFFLLGLQINIKNATHNFGFDLKQTL